MKKSEQICVRIDPKLKSDLQVIADKHKWTLSQTACLILRAYIDSGMDSTKL